VWLLSVLTVALPAAAAPVAQGQAIITSPRDGAQLMGVVQITGSATDPQFDHYELAWTLQGAPDNWQTFAVVHNQVTNGSLGVWDTSQLPPGVYRLRLLIVLRGDKINYAAVNNLSINQGTPTPTPQPTPVIGPTIPPSPTRGAAATPTIIIVQPPTPTPEPMVTARPGAGGTSAVGGPRAPSVQINFASFGEAFCNGVLYTFLIFLAWGIFWSAREIARWVLRRMHTSSLPKS